MTKPTHSRWFTKFAIATIVILSIALQACGSSTPASSGPVNLTFWSWVPGIQKSIDLFNSTHSNIHVTLNQVTAGNNGTYAKMLTALKAGNAPDLGQIEYQFLPTFESVGGLVDLSQYGASSLQSDFVPWTWKQVTVGSSIYAIPQDSGPEAMFYRKDLFTKYNLPVPTTWAQYQQDAVALHKADPTAYITDFPPKDAGWFIGLIWQAGGRWFRINGQSWNINMNDTASMQVATYWQNMLSGNLIKTDPDFSTAWYNDLQTGTVATWLTAVWGANTIMSNAPSTSGDWAVAPMPQWTAGQQVYGNWGGSTTVVFKDSKYPQQAAEFAQWLNTNSQSVQDMVQGAQLYPALQSALTSSYINQPSAFYGGQNIYQVFQTVSSNVDVNFQWGPTMNQVFQDMSDSFSNVTNGQGTLNSALNSLQSGTVTYMQQQGFSVNG